MSTPAAPAPGAPDWREYLTPLNVMLLIVPVAAAVKYGGGSGVWVFAFAGLAIIPLAGYMGKATEALAERLGPAAGGLLNASFGNAAELILALMILAKVPSAQDGLPPDKVARITAEQFELVKATITGSIIGNLLLVLGLSILAGGVRYREQTFNRTNAGVGATLLAIACAALIIPTLYFFLYKSHPTADEARNIVNLSEEIAAVLLVVYALSLLFTLRTHRHLMSATEAEPSAPNPHDGHGEHWSTRKALAVLFASVIGVAVVSEWLVGAVEVAAHSWGMNNVFIGVIVVAIVGNAAEHSTAVLVALKNRMDLSVQIAVGSSIQVALFVAPVLVFASLLMGHPQPLDLHFTPLEVAAVVLSVAVTALVCHDGESNWLEGAMMLALYLILGLAFYHLPGAATGH